MGEVNEMIKELKRYAQKENIPIMLDEGINYLTSFIVKHDINTVLEIGTAIGYSAIMMALVNPKLKIITIERDETRYLEAVKNIKKFNLEERVAPMFNDALDLRLDDKFDLIFIDAAKGQNIKIFENFSKNINDDGYIITDNMNFHGYLDIPEEEIANKNLRSLVTKIKAYHEFLNNHEEFETEFLDVGDGLSISTKK